MKTNTRIELFTRQLPLVAAAFFAAILCVSTARAGMEPKSMEIPQTEPFSWTGFYFSLDAGVVLTNFDVGDHDTFVDLFNQFDDRILPPPPAAQSPSVAAPSGNFVQFASFTSPGRSDTDLQPMVGFDVGYMKQWGHFVVGGSVGFYGTHTQTSTEFSGSQENFIDVGNGTAPSGREFRTETDFISKRRVEETWSGYAGGQLGYAMDHWLFYATGGAAFAQIEVRQLDRAFTSFFFDDLATASPVVSRSAAAPQGIASGTTDSRLASSRGSVQDGWFAGCGLMYAFASNMTAGLEFRHVELGDETYRFRTDGTIFPGQTPVSVENNQILAKITFLLGSRLHK
jgi:opacity protein-like surface antigen